MHLNARYRRILMPGIDSLNARIDSLNARCIKSPKSSSHHSYLPFVLTTGGVHLLLVDVLDLRGRAAQDPLFFLLGQLVRHHLDRLGPLVPVVTATGAVSQSS